MLERTDGQSSRIETVRSFQEVQTETRGLRVGLGAPTPAVVAIGQIHLARSDSRSTLCGRDLLAENMRPVAVRENSNVILCPTCKQRTQQRRDE